MTSTVIRGTTEDHSFLNDVEPAELTLTVEKIRVNFSGEFIIRESNHKSDVWSGECPVLGTDSKDLCFYFYPEGCWVDYRNDKKITGRGLKKLKKLLRELL